MYCAHADCNTIVTDEVALETNDIVEIYQTFEDGYDQEIQFCIEPNR